MNDLDQKMKEKEGEREISRGFPLRN